MDENQKIRPVLSKPKEKRLKSTPADAKTKKISKSSDLLKNMKNEVPQPSTSFDGFCQAKYIFSEANEIIKFGLEKEFALHEKESNLQNTSETIENLRKNIIHLQIEYEKLNQSYQREILQRSEIVKRIDETRNIVESTVTYSNTLSSSIKQLEDDKLKIAEFYELIYQGQKELEEKHSNLDKIINERDVKLKEKIEEIKKANEKTLQQNSETINSLNRKLTYINDKLQVTVNENSKLKSQIQEFTESFAKLESIQLEEQNLKKSQEERIITLTNAIKNLKIKKNQSHKLLQKKQKELKIVKTKFKHAIKKNFKREDSCKEFLEKISMHESKASEYEDKIKQLEEEKNVLNLQLVTQKSEYSHKVTTKEAECEKLIASNETLLTKISALEQNCKEKILNAESLQNEIQKFKEDQEKLKEFTRKLSLEIEKKKDNITELENKVKVYEEEVIRKNVAIENETKKHNLLIKSLEEKMLEEKKKILIEISKKEEIISDLKNNLNKSNKDDQKITNLEKLLEEKTKSIEKLRVELKDKEISLQSLKNEILNNSLENQKSIVKLKEELELQKHENKLLNSKLETIQESKEDLYTELEDTRNKTLKLEAKLNDEKSFNKTLKSSKNELEKTLAALKKDIEAEKNSFDNLKEKYKTTEEELNQSKKIGTENSQLKTKIAELTKLWEEAEAKIEAYKVVTKKLETEKNILSQENIKLKTNNNRADSGIKENKSAILTPQKQNQENTPNTKEENKFQGPLTPIGNTKKILQTPRKIFTSTPQSGHRCGSSFKKKRDPYDFDSDSSIEHFDPDQVLKVFSTRQKKDSTKKPKNTK